MKVTIEFDCSNAAFSGEDFSDDLFLEEVSHILAQADWKIRSQFYRPPASVCTAPESADKLIDSNGNTVGTVILKREDK